MNTTIRTTLSALLLTAAPLACDDGDSQTPDDTSRHAELSLSDGTELLFLAEDDGEVSIIEISPSPDRASLFESLDEGATPAELWVAYAGDEEPPLFLLEHHDTHVDRELDLDAEPVVQLRGWEYADEWGGTTGYCRNNFPSDFEAFNPTKTSVSIAGFTGAPNADAIYGYSNAYVRHAWFAVCNGTSLSSNTTMSEIGLSKWNASINQWVPMLCGAAPNPNWCLQIANEKAKAIHYSTTVPAGQKLRFEASWGAGESHLSKLRAGYGTFGF